MALISTRAFLRQFNGSDLIRLFDLLPDVNFFIKDRDGRFMVLNRCGQQYCGARGEKAAIGKTDHDFFPQGRAAEYRKDDEEVMRTGRPIINRVESAPEAEGSPGLVVTSKLPLRNAQGQVVGIAGVSRRLDQVRGRPGGEARFARLVEQMHRAPETSLCSAAMARMCGLSPSQFDRSFRAAFGTSARQYLLKVRVESACRRLAERDETIAVLALDLGFFDHAHFTRCFRRLMGLTPTEYRKQHRMPSPGSHR